MDGKCVPWSEQQGGGGDWDHWATLRMPRQPEQEGEMLAGQPDRMS